MSKPKSKTKNNSGLFDSILGTKTTKLQFLMEKKE
jgi:hypothetical protein